MQVALMIPCYIDFFYPEVGVATLELLEKLKVDVVYSLLMPGPSGSADIAGTTVHPAQGVTTLTVVFWPREPKGN